MFVGVSSIFTGQAVVCQLAEFGTFSKMVSSYCVVLTVPDERVDMKQFAT